MLNKSRNIAILADELSLTEELATVERILTEHGARFTRYIMDGGPLDIDKFNALSKHNLAISIHSIPLAQIYLNRCPTRPKEDIVAPEGLVEVESSAVPLRLLPYSILLPSESVAAGIEFAARLQGLPQGYFFNK